MIVLCPLRLLDRWLHGSDGRRVLSGNFFLFIRTRLMPLRVQTQYDHSGKRIENTLPLPCPSLIAVIVPPCASTSDLAIANPSPDSDSL